MTTTHTHVHAVRSFNRELILKAIADSFRKLSPRQQFRNPVMFVVFVCSVLTTLLWVQALTGHGEAPTGFIFWVTVWLWFTLLFANFAEALAEGRGKAQAAALRGSRKDVVAKRLAAPYKDAAITFTPSSELRLGHHVLVEAGEQMPGDGEVVVGAASVDESAITGESAPVIRESGGDRSAVTGGTRVLSDWLVVRITANPGESFLDRMIAMVEGASRRKTPNEIALTILLAKFTLIFLLACATLLPYSIYSVQAAGSGNPITHHRAGRAAGVPDSHHHRCAAVGHRHRRHGPHDPRQRDRHFRPCGGGGGRRGRAAAGQDRHDHPGQPPGRGVPARRRAWTRASWPRPRSWPRWPTKRRKVAASWCWPRNASACASASWKRCRREFVPFTAQTRMSGVNSASARSARARSMPWSAISKPAAATCRRWSSAWPRTSRAAAPRR